MTDTLNTPNRNNPHDEAGSLSLFRALAYATLDAGALDATAGVVFFGLPVVSDDAATVFRIVGGDLRAISQALFLGSKLTIFTKRKVRSFFHAIDSWH